MVLYLVHLIFYSNGLVGRRAIFLITLFVKLFRWATKVFVDLKKISSGATFTSIPFRTLPRAAAATFIRFKLGPARAGFSPGLGRGNASRSGCGSWSFCAGLNHSGRESSLYPHLTVTPARSCLDLYFLKNRPNVKS